MSEAPITLNTEALKAFISNGIGKLRAYQEGEAFLQEIEKADAYLAQQKRAGEQAAKLADAAVAAADKRISDAHDAVIKAEADAANQIKAAQDQANTMLTNIDSTAAEAKKSIEDELEALRTAKGDLNADIAVAKQQRDELNDDITALTAQRDALNAALTNVKANLA